MEVKVYESDLYIDGKKLKLPKYLVLCKLGSGSNAYVFKVFNKELHRVEALKVWKVNRKINIYDKLIHISEVQKNARINNKNVATLYYAEFKDDVFYALFEYCEGIELKKLLMDSKFCYVERLSLLFEITLVMSGLYDQGIYHGDLHTKNIIFNKGTIKILDFTSSIFFGKKELINRESSMLFDLSLEIVPELQEFSFYNSYVREKSPKLICECIFGLLYLLFREILDYGDTPGDFYYMMLAGVAIHCKGFCIENIIEYVEFPDLFNEYLDCYEKSDSEKEVSYINIVKGSIDIIRSDDNYKLLNRNAYI